LALYTATDTVAHAVIRRQLAAASTPDARQAVLAAAADTAIAETPVRLDLAQWIATRADSLARVEHTNSLFAHWPLLKSADRAFDRPRMVREAQALLQLGKTIDFSAIDSAYSPLVAAYMSLMKVAYYERGQYPDSVMRLTQLAKTALSPYKVLPFSYLMSFDYKTRTLAQIRDYLCPLNPQQYNGPKTVPPVEAAYWYPSKPAMWPPKGKVSLVIVGDMGGHGGNGLIAGVPISRISDAPLRTVLREWTDAWAAQGLTLMLVERTQGHAVRSLPLTPQEEADSLNWYYRTYLKLPGATLAVVPRAIIWQAPHPADGRRSMADTTALGRWVRDTIGVLELELTKRMVLLYGRDGQLLYGGQYSEVWEQPATLKALILQALHVSATKP
jgi:hypothetical protein